MYLSSPRHRPVTEVVRILDDDVTRKAVVIHSLTSIVNFTTYAN